MEQKTKIYTVTDGTQAVLTAITAIQDAKDAYLQACIELYGDKQGGVMYNDMYERWDAIDKAASELLYNSILESMHVQDGKTILTTL